MPLSSEQVPNNPLTGPELKELVILLLRRQLDNDCVFNPGVAYPRVAFSVSVAFHFSNPHFAKHEVNVRVPIDGAVEGLPPLKEIAAGETHVVDAFRFDVSVENPNLTRVDAEMPIVIVKGARPKPGDMMGGVDRHEVRYEPGGFEKPVAPVEYDLSAATAEKWGVTGAELVTAEVEPSTGPETPKPAKQRRNKRGWQK